VPVLKVLHALGPACRARQRGLRRRCSSVVERSLGKGEVDSSVQTLGGSCRFGKGRICTGKAIKSMPEPGAERAVVDRTANLERQIGAMS
jgi:hypothetical protein